MTKRLAPENRNRPRKTGVGDPMKLCPCCKLELGIRAFAKRAKWCNACRLAPARAKPTGPTLTEREEARARADVSRFADFAAKVRAEFGVPSRRA